MEGFAQQHHLTQCVQSIINFGQKKARVTGIPRQAKATRNCAGSNAGMRIQTQSCFDTRQKQKTPEKPARLRIRPFNQLETPERE